jgi:homoserine/homoserine lactone efflux protein
MSIDFLPARAKENSMDIGLYFLFFTTTIMLILVPGPSAITAAKQGARHNNKLTFLTVLGLASGDVIFFVLSATGIASLIVASSLAFSIIKWFGVAYLLFLGLAAIFIKAGGIKIDTDSSGDAKLPDVTPLKAFSQGLVIQLANPKALMYFSALLPQFIDPNEPLMFQMLLMGVTCVLADILVYSVFGRMGDKLARQNVKGWVISLINKTAGLMLITTGIRMAALGAK